MAPISTISSSITTGGGAKKSKKKKIGIWTILMICAGAGCLMGILVFSSLHSATTTTTTTSTLPQRRPSLQSADTDEKQGQDGKTDPKKSSKTGGSSSAKTGASKKAESARAKLAGLQCDAHGGPWDEAALDEMIYWRDLPQDEAFQSPFYDPQVRRYMTFEPDAGGWNNIRMAMETVLSLAHATGRTLVMPPEQRMYLLAKNADQQKTHFSFADFFHLDRVGAEHAGLDIITMEDYLQREALAGRLRHKDTRKPAFPPQNRTNWDGQDTKPLWQYLRSVTHVVPWRPLECVAVFPASTDEAHVAQLEQWKDEILAESGPQGAFPMTENIPNGPDFTGRPTDMNASTKERLREMLAKRSSLCIYNHQMQQYHSIHFGKGGSEGSARLLIHFYAWLFFQDSHQDLWNKRFMRDHLRYIDLIQCAAARVVQALRQRAGGEFDALHVRRGDFQYKKTRLSATELRQKSQGFLKKGMTLYIATDERDKSFFDALRQDYDICFLDDFRHEFQGLNTNYYGMLDQLVASRARVFVGTFFSTFSGFINRMRGYHVGLRHEDGWQEGTLASYYFVPDDKQMEMATYTGIRPPFYSREYPISWRQIDWDVPDEDKDAAAATSNTALS